MSTDNSSAGETGPAPASEHVSPPPEFQDDVKPTSGNPEEKQSSSSTIDCAICLETAVFPVELPCSHCFCYLCLKGTALSATQHGQRPRCSMCRSDIPLHILTNPSLKEPVLEQQPEASDNEYQWYYESRGGGWWQFEKRHNVELERAFEAKEPKCNLLIVGQMYEIDLQQMIQYRPTTRHIIRRIKRDFVTMQKKGIAGIRLNSLQNPSQGNGSFDLGTQVGSATALLGASDIEALATGNLGNLVPAGIEMDSDEDDDDGERSYMSGSDYSYQDYERNDDYNRPIEDVNTDDPYPDFDIAPSHDSGRRLGPSPLVLEHNYSANSAVDDDDDDDVDEVVEITLHDMVDVVDARGIADDSEAAETENGAESVGNPESVAENTGASETENVGTADTGAVAENAETEKVETEPVPQATGFGPVPGSRTDFSISRFLPRLHSISNMTPHGFTAVSIPVGEPNGGPPDLILPPTIHWMSRSRRSGVIPNRLLCVVSSPSTDSGTPNQASDTYTVEYERVEEPKQDQRTSEEEMDIDG